jgi:hypothetical protein
MVGKLVRLKEKFMRPPAAGPNPAKTRGCRALQKAMMSPMTQLAAGFGGAPASSTASKYAAVGGSSASTTASAGGKPRPT